MIKKTFKLLSSVLLVLVMFGAFTNVVKADDVIDYTIVIGDENPNYQTSYHIKSDGSITLNDNAADLPTGLTWDGTDLTLTDYQGSFFRISANGDQAEDFNLILSGNNSLSGGSSYFNNTALSFSNIFKPTIGGDGKLNVDIDRTSHTTAIAGGGYQDGALIVEDSCTINVKVRSDASANAFNTWFLTIKDSANVYAEVYSKVENSNIFSSGGLIMNSSGNCVFKSNGEYVNSGWGYSIGGEGSLTCYKTGSDRSTSNQRHLSAISPKTLSDYVIHGNGTNQNNLSAVLSVQHSAKEAEANALTVLEMPLTAPATDAKLYYSVEAKDTSNNVEYVGDIKWYYIEDDEAIAVTNGSIFNADTIYRAEVTLATLPGYTLNGLTANSFTAAGSTSCIYDDEAGVVTIDFAETGESILPKIGTEFAIDVPVAGEEINKSTISGEGYTATPSYKNVTANATGEATFQYSSYYEVTLTINFDEEHTVNGLTSDDFTIADVDEDEYTVEYTPGSNVVKFIFTNPTEYRYIVYFGTTEYNLPTQIDDLPEGVTFEYEDITSKFTLNGYNGPAIVSSVPSVPLNLYLVGDNTITASSFSSYILNNQNLTLGLATYNGEITINGDDNSSLNIFATVDDNYTNETYGVTSGYANIILGKPDLNVKINGETALSYDAVGIRAIAPNEFKITGNGSVYVETDVVYIGVDDDGIKHDNGEYKIIAAFEATPVVTSSGSLYMDVLQNGTSYYHSYNGIDDDSLTHNAIGYISYRNYEKQAGFYNKDVAYLRFTLDREFYPYTGEEIEPAVYIPGLDVDEDYTIEYSNNTEIGTGTITITGIGKFTGTKNIEFEIRDVKELKESNTKITLSQTSFKYNGTAFEPTVKSVVYTRNGVKKTLTKGIDYTVSYSNNINAGTGTVTIEGVNNYCDSVEASFNIAKADNTITIDECPTSAYVGKADQLISAHANEAATITYSVKDVKLAAVNEDAGEYYLHLLKSGTVNLIVNAQETANYKATTKTVKVIAKAPIDISKGKGISIGKAIWDMGSGIEPTVIIKNGKITYTEGVDYNVSYELVDSSGNPAYLYDVGNYIKVTVDASDLNKFNLSGIYTKNIKIEKAPQELILTPSDTTVYRDKESVTVDISALGSPEFTYKVSSNASYIVNGHQLIITPKSNNGTIIVSVTAKETANYLAASQTVKIAVKDPLDVNKAKVTTVGPAVWNNGSAIEPTVVVKSGKITYVEDEDYTVSYNLQDSLGNPTSNYEVGNFIKVSVDARNAAMHKCKGLFEKTIEIVKADQPATASLPATIYYGTNSSEQSKQPVQIALNDLPLTLEDNPTITYTASGKGIVSIDENGLVTPLKAGKTTITISIGETPHYKAKTIKLTLNVKKAVVITSKMITLKATYNDGLNVVPEVYIKGYAEGVDYTVSYDNKTNVGDVLTVEVQSISTQGGLLESANKTVTIVKGTQNLNISGLPSTMRIGDIENFTINNIKDGALVKIAASSYVRITDLGANNYTITGLKAGTATITISYPATSNYNAGKTTLKVKVTK